MSKRYRGWTVAVLSLFLLVALFGIIGCKGLSTTSTQSPVNVVKRVYWAYLGETGGSAIEIYIEPTNATEVDKIYVVTLYKRGVELHERYAKWDGLELSRLAVKTIAFYIAESDYLAYMEGNSEAQISSVFTTSVRAATSGEVRLIEDSPGVFDSWFAK